MRSLLVDLGVIIVMAVLVVGVVVQLADPSPIADPVSVPGTLATLGYSPEVVTNRLIARSRAIEQENNAVADRLSAAAATTGNANPLNSVTVPGVGVSLSAVVAGLRSFFGLPSRRIGGSVIVEESGDNRGYRMTVWVSGRNPAVHTGKVDASIEHVIEHGARALTGLLRPCALAAALLGDRDGQGWLDDCINDPSRRDIEWAHNLRGLQYLAERKYDEAIAQFEEALKHVPGYRDARQNLAKARREKGADSSATGPMQPR